MVLRNRNQNVKFSLCCCCLIGPGTSCCLNVPFPISHVTMAGITFLEVRMSKKLIKLNGITILLVEKLGEREVLVIFSKSFFFRKYYLGNTYNPFKSTLQPILHLLWGCQNARYCSLPAKAELKAHENKTVFMLITLIPWSFLFPGFLFHSLISDLL